MTKKIFWIVVVIGMLIVAPITAQRTHAFNYQWFDTVFEYDRAIIALPNGEVIDGRVELWRDYENSDQIQVKIDGVIYLVHSMDIALISE